MRPGLSRIRRLLAVLEHPHRSFRSILVTGSNGKGTTCAVLSSCLQGLGWKTGMFTSPHLVSVRERFRVNGECASQAAMHRFLRLYGPVCHRTGATYFETTTAFALWWFRQSGVEWAVLEIGLGGRHDACNAVDAELSIVTSIALEHTQWLGSTQERIASEKGCVARPGKPTLAGPLGSRAQRSLRRTVESRGGHMVSTGREIGLLAQAGTERGTTFTVTCLGESLGLRTRLPGRKAVLNAALAAAAAMHVSRDPDTLQFPAGWKSALRRSVKAARWPARLEVISTRPRVVLDVAHNAAAVAALVADWRALFPSQRPVIVAGLLDDKPAQKIGSLLSQLTSEVVITRPDSTRALDPDLLARAWSHRFERITVEPKPALAFQAAQKLAKARGCILVTGSHFLVGPILSHLGCDPARTRGAGTVEL